MMNTPTAPAVTGAPRPPWRAWRALRVIPTVPSPRVLARLWQSIDGDAIAN